MMMYIDKNNNDKVNAYLNFYKSNLVVSAGHCVIGKENLNIIFFNLKSGKEYKLFN